MILFQLVHRSLWFLIVLFLGSTFSWAQQDDVSKTGTALGTGSTTEVVGGDTLRWVIEYENLSGGILEDIQVDDSIGAHQTFVPGSLEVPPGWQAHYSNDDGTSYPPGEPVGVTDVRATATRVGSLSTSTVVEVPAPLADVANTATGGDGTVPILFGNRIFMIFHHQHFAYGMVPNINCIERATGATCPGYPYSFESTPGPGGSGVGDIGTTTWPEQDGQLIVNGSQLLYGAQRADDWGVGCWDMVTASNCGYVQLSTDGAASGFEPAVFEGPHRIGDRLYFADFRNAVYCYDLTTNMPCTGYPVDVADAAEGMPDYDLPQHDNRGVIMGMEALGDRLYFTQNYTGIAIVGMPQSLLGARLTCFDTTTNARCAGWTSIFLTDSDFGTGAGPLGLYARRTVAGVADAICAAVTTSVANGSPANQCFDLVSGNSVAAPAALSTALTAHPGGTLRLELNVGTRTYFAFGSRFGNGWEGHTICYDWSLDGLCPGFDTLDDENDGLRQWFEFSPDRTRDYGYAAEGNCLFGLGDAGLLWSFDPTTGATPCMSTSLRTAITAADFFCDGQSHTVTWDQVEIAQVDLTPDVEFSSLTVEIFDAAGTSSLLGPIELVGNPGANPIDISSIPFGPGTETLVVEVQATAMDSGAWEDGEPPLVITTFNADSGAQICLETQVADICDTIVGPIVNTVTTSREAMDSASLDFLENVETCPACRTCETHPNGDFITVFVDEDVMVDFNPFLDTGANPTCDDGATSDLCDSFAFDTSGPTPETWRAIFDLGGKKLVVGDNSTVTMVNVPPVTGYQKAPGFEFTTTCEIEIEDDLDDNGKPGTIAIDGLNGNTGDIAIQAEGQVRIDGHVRNTNDGLHGAVGDIRIGSCCGGVVTGPHSRVETENHIDAGDIDIVTCCGSDIVIGGLVRAAVAISPTPTIRVIAFEGSVTIDGTSDFGQESVAGALVRRTSGLLARTLERGASGHIQVQAQGDVTVIGREILSSQKQNGAIAIRSSEEAGPLPYGEIRVISLEGQVMGIDRAFDVAHRFAGGNKITLHALDDINLSVTATIDFGAGSPLKPVLNARGGQGSAAAGGINTLRSFQGNVVIGENVQVLANAVGGSTNTGGTNTLDARAGSSQVTIASGAQILATAGGIDGNNEIDSCLAPSIDPFALVGPAGTLTSQCLMGETPPALSNPFTDQPLTCEDFGLHFGDQELELIFGDGFESGDTSAWD